MSKHSRYFCLLLITTMLGGACVSRPPESINCDKIRALALGMSKEQVVVLLGQPSEATEKWFEYSPMRIFGGIYLTAEFRDERLVRVSSHKRYTWSDFNPTIFVLDKDGFFEGGLFLNIYCPGK